MSMKYIVAFFFAAALVCAPVSGMAEQPLPQEGKTSVFQRVVSHPGAKLYSDASASAVVGDTRTFTPYYVYEKRDDMLRVGVSSTGADGWMKLAETTYWPQAITMVFTEQMGRQPVLFFRNHEAVQDLCAADSIKDTVEQYITLFTTPGARTPADLPVIAIEPHKDGQVSQRNFYLLPVLDMDAQFKESGTQLLQVACLNPGIAKKEEVPAQKLAKASDGMTTGIVFIIDTTISMKSYIDQTREVIRAVYDRLQESPARDKVAIAVVAFRSNMQKSRGNIEYNTKIISDFTTVAQRQTLEGMLEDVEECRASTHAFDEDSLAGVKAAVDRLSWNKVDAKAMLLITDAGPLVDDTSSTGGMSPEGMADYLRVNKIFLTVAHVKSHTASAKKDHAYAEKSYKELSLLSNNRSSYIPIDAPTPEAGAETFKSVGKLIAETYCKIAEKQFEGGALRKPKTEEPPRTASPEEQARRNAEAIGYAMQLQFMGDSRDVTAPQVVSAWIADCDLTALEEHPNAAPLPVVEPAVLLTKAQLSQLRKQVKSIIATAEEAFLQDNENFNFYEQLISAAAQMSRDPSSFDKNPEANLAKKGVLLEVLDGLPYKSRVLRLRQEDWLNMSTGEQQTFIKRLKGLVRSYEEYDRDNSHWEGFGSSNANEWVYRVPLKMLP